MQTRNLAGPLRGIRVLDLSRNLAGPFCTMLLGDLGADVVKIEAPGTGDDTRGWLPPDWSGHSAAFLAANRNKRSAVFDLDRPTDLSAVARLARTADVLVQSFKPGSLERRGLGYDALRVVNPRLIYCHITAYGGRGPKRDHPGYDPILQADTGIMDLTGYPEGPPTRLGVGAIDLGTALWASVGIQTALLRRLETGAGGFVEVSLYETSMWLLSYHLIGLLGSGHAPTRQGTGTPFVAPYEAFHTADGDLMVTAANDGAFARLCEQLQAPELVCDTRFRHNADRVRHRAELREHLQERFDTKSAGEWERVLAQASVPCSRVRSVRDLRDDEQIKALEMLVDVPHPDIPDLRLLDMPMSLDGQRAARHTHPPRLGEHNQQVLPELGIDWHQAGEGEGDEEVAWPT